MAHIYPPRAETPVSPLVSPLIEGFPTVPAGSTPQHRLSGRNDASDVSPLLRATRSPNVMSRSGSTSSFSTASVLNTQLISSPTNVYPAATYVAAFGASQVVSERKRHFSDDENDGVRTILPSRDDTHFSVSALALLNTFLDHLLFSFLAHARSTTLTALRPAVTEVLKSRLATEAIASAEEELQELLGGGEDEEEEMNQRQTLAEQSRTWDTELVWKRTRLRVMVYIRLGEMEDEDEERYVREDELFHSSDHRFSQSTGLVSWAAAIFLTSVLEYVAEQVLQAASKAADGRTRRQLKNPRTALSPSGMVTPVDGVTVEDFDMEKVALNSMLGRLWRTWRKSLRSTAHNNPLTPATSTSNNNNFSRRFSRDASATGQSARRSSLGVESVLAMEDGEAAAESVDGGDAPENNVDEVPEAEYPEHVLAANIPLPLADSKRDVDEIEVPGLASDPDESQTDGDRTPKEADVVRRNSLTGSAPLNFVRSGTELNQAIAGSDSTSDETPAPVEVPAVRVRASSLPTLPKGLFFPPTEEVTVVESTDTAVVDPESPSETVQAQGPDAVDAAESSDESMVSALEEPQEPDSALPKTSETESPVDEADSAPPKTAKVESPLSKLDCGSAAAAEAAVIAVYGSKFSKADAPKSVQPAEIDIDERDNQKQVVDDKRLSIPVVAEPAVVKPVVAEPVVVKPVVDKPIVDKPVVDKPVVDKPVVDKPVVDEPVVAKSVVAEPVVVEPEEVPIQQEQPQTAKRMSLTQVNVPPIVVQTKSRSPSPQSFTLTDKDEQVIDKPIAKPRHLSEEFDETHEDSLEDDVDIGVAKTSDTAVSTTRAENAAAEWRYARDSFTNPAPRRQSRLILGASSPEPPSSPARKESPPARMSEDVTPRSFLEKRALAVTAKAPQTERVSPSRPSLDQTRSSASKKSGQASAPNTLDVTNESNGIAQPVSPIEKTPSPWRQSFSAAANSVPWSPAKKSPSPSEPSVAVQEHPVVQKMASMKNANGSKSKEEENSPVVSASIKGPEDFEMFVQGGDTVKYTLTPENVRDGSSPTHAVSYSTVRSTERTPSSDKAQSSNTETRLGRSQSLRQATSAAMSTPSEADPGSTSKKDKRRSISRPPVRNTSVHRRSGLIAREPQVMTESTRDFADFIRSTGPTKEPEISLLANKSTTSLHSMLQSNRRGSRASSPGGRSLNRVPMPAENVPPVPSLSSRIKANMQPREATSNADGSSDLIDFIRTGPNASRQSGESRQHRISRAVAPFRSTEDSDQLSEWGDRIAAQPDLKLDTKVDQATSLKSAPSLKTNSKSANPRSVPPVQTNANDAVHPAHSGQPQRLSGKPLSAPAEPKRYRGKDPYPIDFLDDEDDDLLTALPKTKREEESMVDFLTRTEPPTNNGISKNEPASRPTTGNRRGSAPGMKAHGIDAIRIGRRDSTSAKDGTPIKTVANMGVPRVQGTTSVAVGPISNARQKLEARGLASASGGETADLADFLRGSGPTGAPAARPTPTSREHSKTSTASSTRSKTSARISAFFSGGFFSRKQPAKQAYLDM